MQRTAEEMWVDGYADRGILARAAVALLMCWHPHAHPMDVALSVQACKAAVVEKWTPRRLWASHPYCNDGTLPPLPAELLADPEWLATPWQQYQLDPNLWLTAWEPAAGGISPWAASWWARQGFNPRSAVEVWRVLVERSAG